MKAPVSLAILLAVTSTALGATSSSDIQGNPLGHFDDYTVNSSSKKTVKLKCLFKNTSNEQAKLNVWTSPKQTKPVATIHLKASSKGKPSQIKKSFKLKLKNKWWCRMYVPEPNKQWQYCGYFSVSDATIVKVTPFKTWDKTLLSKKTQYHCEIKPATQSVRFFYYK